MGALAVAPPWKALRETPYLSWTDNISGLHIQGQTDAPEMKSKLFLLSRNDTRIPFPNCVQLLQTAAANATAGHSTIVAERAERNKRLKSLKSVCQSNMAVPMPRTR